MSTPVTCTDTSDALRARMVEELRAKKWIRTQPVADAMGSLAKESFLPGADLALVYSADDTVPVKRNADGHTVSSASAPWLVAHMLEEARIQPGDRVLEIGGARGINAALAAQLVGPAGRVVSVEIDPELVDDARAALAGAGITNVDMRCGDGHYGAADAGPFDAVIVTAQATDLATTWREQAAPGARIVVPLTLLGLSRCYTFQPCEDGGGSWRAERQLLCGFVAMQGDGAHRAERIALPGDAELHVTDALDVAADRVLGLAQGEQKRVWTGVQVARMEPVIPHLDQYLSTRLTPYLRYFGPSGQILDPGGERLSWLGIGHSATATTGALTYVVMRQVDERFHEFGVFAHGPDAGQAAQRLADLVRRWDAEFRGGADAVVHAFPADTPDGSLPPGRVVDRPGTRFVIAQAAR
ncbi:methyltransferase, FxLD system [Streptacidiphilus jiangxiensis]|uniref:Protein-L-isoaspartate O-methyltransferase n=1 Tax=Streptacidiphilus jiangxiensis TaxID=235985 RepID=A0A1H7NPR2_STRJI|nr:methyltransferase, FxLD system [Streptacidiphilus jiangxiensis]SEL25436.1 protein-L-isoaspartate(D-aspartate) O-methyltransferase [Streptacidiphilus jiangxiensis]